jgi:cell wall-associated NlpC family hydrolase
MPAFPVRIPAASLRAAGEPAFRWSDLGAPYGWARPAVRWVAGTNDWMRDFPAKEDGTYPFHPSKLEARKFFARALVRALAPNDAPDPDIAFTDLPAESHFYRWANVAVSRGWLTKGADGGFHPSRPVTTMTVHRAVVRALGMEATAAEIDALHTRDGAAFDTPKNLGVLMLGMRLGLRYNNKVNEWQDVGPTTELNRAQVAYSLYRATTLESWVVPWLADQYAGIELPWMASRRRAIVQWGLGYVAYPYVWGGEWGLDTPEPSALGGQPVAGFDCTGITWWVMRKNDGGYWRVAPPRPYEGWSLPQRVSRDMATMTLKRLAFGDLVPGDVMFYDGDRDGVVDHADVFVGNGWAIDSSSSVGGVTLMWVGDGWYRDHFKWGRRIVPLKGS